MPSSRSFFRKTTRCNICAKSWASNSSSTRVAANGRRGSIYGAEGLLFRVARDSQLFAHKLIPSKLFVAGDAGSGDLGIGFGCVCQILFFSRGDHAVDATLKLF